MATRPMMNRVIRTLCAIIAVFTITGCAGSVKSISPSTVDYFKSLEGQKYWTSTKPQLTLDTPEESKAVFVSDDAGERFLLFGKVDILATDKKGNPTQAVINTTTYEGGKTSTYAFLVSESNRARLVGALKTFETDQERTERLRREEEERRKKEEQRKREQEIAQRMQALKKRLKSSYDEFRQITFVEHPLEEQTVSKWKPSFFPYIGYDKQSKWMFLRAQILASDWLFMDSAIVLIGQTSYETPQYPSYDRNVTQEVVGGGIYERIDFRWSEQKVQAIGRAIANAPLGTKIKVRFQGKYYKDFTLTQAEHQAWKDMIFYFDNLKPGS